MAVMNVSRAIEMASNTLRQSGVSEPEREASSLLRFVLKQDATFLYAHREYQLDAVESILFKAVVKRRAGREPFQYISGKQEFYGLEFAVTSKTLIPRPETEIIVETAIDRSEGLGHVRFLELGVGSGCISIAILKNLPHATAVGVDISEPALNVAAQNAEKHQVGERLSLIRSDLFNEIVPEAFDLIVSNPPYVLSSDITLLQPEVRDHEPRAALDGGADGLDIVRSIVQNGAEFLRPGGLLLLEIGIGQSGKVADLFDRDTWSSVEFLRDLQGIERTVFASKK